jgi:hypothetical protein
VNDAPSLDNRLAAIERQLAGLTELLQAGQRRWLSVPEAAAHAAVSPDAIRSMIAAGKLTPHYPVSGRVIVDKRELDGAIVSSTRSARGRGRKAVRTERKRSQ